MSQNLIVKPSNAGLKSGAINSVDLRQTGWKYLTNMTMVRLRRGEFWQEHVVGAELIIAVLAGRLNVESNRGTWKEIGRRLGVFDGMPHALYLPKDTQWRLEALSECVEVAVCWAMTEEERQPCLITPGASKIEIRGGGHATRQINSIVPPGVAASKLVCVEVFTPGGNWSSYPPHKHDVSNTINGEVIEAELEEIYFYKFRRPEGFAVQRVYTHDRSIDATLSPGDNDIVLVPRGYHPVSAAPGYDCYYLNFIAGQTQSLTASDDPDYAWVKSTWSETDPRLPMVSHAMEDEPAQTLSGKQAR